MSANSGAGLSTTWESMAHPRGGIHRLGYMPALDGIRALAVLGVMGYHGGLSILPAGFFGVDAFFVLSGFLITSLLIREWSDTGGIALRSFWARRARRLLPALLVMIVFVALYVRFIAVPGAYPGLLGDGLASLFYVANWHFALSGQSYFAQASAVSPLLHTWSLAIEEQFYIVWPLLLLLIFRLRGGRSTSTLRILLGVSVVGALLSAAEMAILFNPAQDPSRAYYGTDTHAQSLLVGTALAAGIALWRLHGEQIASSGRGRVLLTAVGLMGFAVAVFAWTHAQFGQTFVFRGGFFVTSLAVAAVICSVVLHPSGVLGRMLALPPLRFLGKISYGMYLWHFPLFIVFTNARTGLSGWPLFLFRTAATIVVSFVSFHVIERPIRSGTLVGRARARFVTVSSVVGTFAVLVLATVTSTASATPIAPVVPGQIGVITGSTVSVPPSLVNAPVRVLLLGDSVADTLGVGLAIHESRWHVVIDNLTILGCGVAMGPTVRGEYRGQFRTMLLNSPPCGRVPGRPDYGEEPETKAWTAWVREVRPNVVVLLAGRWEAYDRYFNGHWTNILHSDFANHTRQALTRAVRIGTSMGAHMVLMTTPCYEQIEEPNGTVFPEDNPRRVRAYNRIVHEVASQFPSTVIAQDLYSLACPQGVFQADLHGAPLRFPDGIHFNDSGPGAGGDILGPAILPVWEHLGHEQEALGGTVMRGALPSRKDLAPK